MPASIAATARQAPLDAEKPSALTNVKDMCLKETLPEGSFRPKMNSRFSIVASYRLVEVVVMAAVVSMAHSP